MARARHYREGTDKLRELILLVCLLSEKDAAFGSVKLNKLLFYIDFGAYLKFGAPISGQEYVRQANGPVPAGMRNVVESMKDSDELVLVERDYFGRAQKRPVAMREPLLGRFTPEHMLYISLAVQKFADMSASEISDLSHQFIGWKYGKNGETIPYSTALIERREPTEKEKARAFEFDMSAVAEMMLADGIQPR